MKNRNQEFVKVIGENQKLIHKVCNVYAENTEDRKDLFQDIVMQLWKSYPGFKGQSKITTWMYRVALNTAITQKRKKKGVYIGISEVPLSEKGDKSVGAQDNSQLLRTLINQLNPVQKSIILLYLEEKSYDEIADILGMTKSNVSVRLVRIKRLLEAKFKAETK